MRENLAASILLQVFPSELKPVLVDSFVGISQAASTLRFKPVWVGEGLPADVQRGKNSIMHGFEQNNDVTHVMVARQMSVGARELLEASDISWVDSKGYARIAVSDKFYLTRLQPVRSIKKVRFRWSEASQTIAERMLSLAVQQDWKSMPLERPGEIAEATGFSAAHTARVLLQFDEQGYTAKTGAERGVSAGRIFKDPGRLLSDWVGNYVAAGKPGEGLDYHVPWRDVGHSIETLKAVLDGIDWMLTSEAAADLIAPYLITVPTLEAYFPHDMFHVVLDRMNSHKEFREVKSGGRVRLLQADPHLLMLPKKHELKTPTVNPVRVYADLLRHEGRSAEAAQNLREIAIGF